MGGGGDVDSADFLCGAVMETLGKVGGVGGGGGTFTLRTFAVSCTFTVVLLFRFPPTLVCIWQLWQAIF